MLTKIKWDVENTGRARRWADIARPYLRLFESLIISEAPDLEDLNIKIDKILREANTTYEIFSALMMIQDFQELAGNYRCALVGPSYVAKIENMLDEADATAKPGIGYDWKHYKWVIENYLYGTQGNTPVLVIPRRSTTAKREIVEFAEGALQVVASISQEFNSLITEVKKSELPKDFPVDKLIFELNELKKQIMRSTGFTTEITYPAYLRDKNKIIPVNTRLGHLYGDVFGEVAERVAKKTKVETYIEIAKLVETGESGILLLTIKYKIPGVQKELKIAQRVTSLAGLSISLPKRVLYSNAEDEFYMLPQEMVLALPTELSNLWQIADDTNQYILNLLNMGKIKNEIDKMKTEIAQLKEQVTRLQMEVRSLKGQPTYWPQEKVPLPKSLIVGGICKTTVKSCEFLKEGNLEFDLIVENLIKVPATFNPRWTSFPEKMPLVDNLGNSYPLFALFPVEEKILSQGAPWEFHLVFPKLKRGAEAVVLYTGVSGGWGAGTGFSKGSTLDYVGPIKIEDIPTSGQSLQMISLPKTFLTDSKDWKITIDSYQLLEERNLQFTLFVENLQEKVDKCKIADITFLVDNANNKYYRQPFISPEGYKEFTPHMSAKFYVTFPEVDERAEAVTLYLSFKSYEKINEGLIIGPLKIGK